MALEYNNNTEAWPCFAVLRNALYVEYPVNHTGMVAADSKHGSLRRHVRFAV